MKANSAIVLNIDDSDGVYDNLYDPELSTLFCGRIVHESIWTPETMIMKKQWTYLAGETEEPPSNPYTVLSAFIILIIDHGLVKRTS